MRGAVARHRPRVQRRHYIDAVWRLAAVPHLACLTGAGDWLRLPEVPELPLSLAKHHRPPPAAYFRRCACAASLTAAFAAP